MAESSTEARVLNCFFGFGGGVLDPDPVHGCLDHLVHVPDVHLGHGLVIDTTMAGQVNDVPVQNIES